MDTVRWAGFRTFSAADAFRGTGNFFGRKGHGAGFLTGHTGDAFFLFPVEPDKAEAIKPAINCPKGAQVLAEGPVDFHGEQEKQKQDPQLPEEQSAGLSPEQRIGSQKRQGAKEGAGRA